MKKWLNRSRLRPSLSLSLSLRLSLRLCLSLCLRLSPSLSPSLCLRLCLRLSRCPSLCRSPPLRRIERKACRFGRGNHPLARPFLPCRSRVEGVPLRETLSSLRAAERVTPSPAIDLIHSQAILLSLAKRIRRDECCWLWM